MCEEKEYRDCKGIIKTYDYRSDIPPDNVVVPRYSALPYYKELQYDLEKKNCALINSYSQHQWIANFDWYYDPQIQKRTFKSYSQDEFPYAPEGAYVVKGETNSKKWNWDKEMFAPTKKDAIRIGANLCSDSLIGSQKIFYREYIPLETFEVGINGLPFSNEWRFFYLGCKLIDYGYYWSCAQKTMNRRQCPGPIMDLAETVCVYASKHVNFYVLDVAMTREGQAILVEINDGSMSGLSNINSHSFYRRLKSYLLNQDIQIHTQ